MKNSGFIQLQKYRNLRIKTKKKGKIKVNNVKAKGKLKNDKEKMVNNFFNIMCNFIYSYQHKCK